MPSAALTPISVFQVEKIIFSHEANLFDEGASDEHTGSTDCVDACENLRRRYAAGGGISAHSDDAAGHAGPSKPVVNDLVGSGVEDVGPANHPKALNGFAHQLRKARIAYQ